MAPPKQDTAREKIIEAAGAVAVRDGARHLTLDAAAREAGVSKGGVLYHFPNKRALLDAMLLRFQEGVEADVAKQRRALAGRPNRTLRAINAALRDRLGPAGDVRICLIAGAIEEPGLLAPVRRMFDAHQAAIRSETSDPAGAMAIWAAIEGLQYMSLFDICPGLRRDSAAIADRIDAMIDRLPAAEDTA